MSLCSHSWDVLNKCFILIALNIVIRLVSSMIRLLMNSQTVLRLLIASLSQLYLTFCSLNKSKLNLSILQKILFWISLLVCIVFRCFSCFWFKITMLKLVSLPLFLCNALLCNCFENAQLLQDVGHMNFFFNLLIMVEQDSFFPISFTGSTLFWPVPPKIECSHSAAVPIHFFYFAMDCVFSCQHGTIRTIAITLKYFWSIKHFTCEVHVLASILKHGNQSAKEGPECTEETT